MPSICRKLGASTKTKKSNIKSRHEQYLEKDVGTNNALRGVLNMSDVNDNEFGFVDLYDEENQVESESLLPKNTFPSGIKCGFLGLGGGGGKLAKAFIDIGFTQTILVNTTDKDLPEGVAGDHFLRIPDADGVGKDVEFGKKILSDNSSTVEDAVRVRIGEVDWLFVLVGGGGGTGSAGIALKNPLGRYLKSTGASGRVVYVVSKPTAQELLNPTITKNWNTIKQDVASEPHIIIDNDKQSRLLRKRAGLLNLFPIANAQFAKMLSQVLKLSGEHSPIQTFDSKDLEACLLKSGRMVLGSCVIKDTEISELGSKILQTCLRTSPCPKPDASIDAGAMMLLVPPSMASDPEVSADLEAAFSYVGGRTNTLFSGIYIKDNVPGLIALTLLTGIK